MLICINLLFSKNIMADNIHDILTANGGNIDCEKIKSWLLEQLEVCKPSQVEILFRQYLQAEGFQQIRRNEFIKALNQLLADDEISSNIYNKLLAILSHLKNDLNPTEFELNPMIIKLENLFYTNHTKEESRSIRKILGILRSYTEFESVKNIFIRLFDIIDDPQDKLELDYKDIDKFETQLFIGLCTLGIESAIQNFPKFWRVYKAYHPDFFFLGTILQEIEKVLGLEMQKLFSSLTELDCKDTKIIKQAYINTRVSSIK